MKIRNSNWHFRGSLILLVFLLGLSACSAGSSELPTPVVNVTPAPTIGSIAQDFLSAWEKEDYESMYALLSQQSQSTISKEDFINFYQNMVENLTLQSLTAEVMHESTSPGMALIDYRVSYQTALFEQFERDLQMELVLQDDQWRIQWENGLILPELKGGNSLALELQVPNRGNILDRKGEAIVSQTEAYALGIIPGQIGEGQEGRLLSYLSQLTGKTTQAIQASYQNVGGDWYVAVGEASADEVNQIWNNLISLGGILLSPYTSRYYYSGGVAPQAIGYVLSISEENLEDYKRLGYLGDEKVGQAGLEKYAEDALAGKAEASLYVVDPNGQIITRLNQSDPRPAQNITTTLDKELQLAAQQAISGFSGAVVVMEIDTGRILAMASSPSIDPNLFDPENRNNEVLNQLLNDGSQRLLNRATQSGYPLGSVFKIITMAAALESDLYTADSEYYCDHYFTELPGERFKDWTVDKELPPSGNLNLVNGLMRSCNPWFYHIGLDLFRQKGATTVSDMARGFGLGSATGIEQVAEDPGNIPDPKTDGDAVQLAIGQGETLVTPLQVVRFVAAIANGGTLYRPQIIEDMTTTTGVTVYSFTAQESGKLPVSAETLETIQEGMRRVIKSKSGTAYDALEGINIAMYGKTGTATTSIEEPHSWFVGYTQTGREDKPDIAVAVIAENAGEGSEIAAPIFRRIIEVYYFGRPLKVYPWETIINVTRTPTLKYTLTPTETPYRPPQEVEPTDTPAG